MMLEELERRNYSAGTTRRYLRFVERFAQHFHKSPDKLGPDDLRSYQAYLLTELKLCPGSVENHVAALRFFFVRTLHRHQFREFLPYPKTRKKLPDILSQEEVARLINASSSLFQRTQAAIRDCREGRCHVRVRGTLGDLEGQVDRAKAEDVHNSHHRSQ